MNELDIEAIRERERRATPGPWRWRATTIHRSTWNPAEEFFAHARLGGGDGGHLRVFAADAGTVHDAQFVASSRTDIPALLSENDRLRAALTAAEEARVALTDALKVAQQSQEVRCVKCGCHLPWPHCIGCGAAASDARNEELLERLSEMELERDTAHTARQAAERARDDLIWLAKQAGVWELLTAHLNLAGTSFAALAERVTAEARAEQAKVAIRSFFDAIDWLAQDDTWSAAISAMSSDVAEGWQEACQDLEGVLAALDRDRPPQPAQEGE